MIHRTTTDAEATILRLLTAKPTHIEQLWRKSGISLSIFSSTLAAMVLKGTAKLIGDMNYIIGDAERHCG